ncbi:MAG: hypothetical protein HQ592_18475 [Planctomycetes bacterium]|nr:hypothetical protein [Planctomycetota bacterium]
MAARAKRHRFVRRGEQIKEIRRALSDAAREELHRHAAALEQDVVTARQLPYIITALTAPTLLPCCRAWAEQLSRDEDVPAPAACGAVVKAFLSLCHADFPDLFIILSSTLSRYLNQALKKAFETARLKWQPLWAPHRLPAIDEALGRLSDFLLNSLRTGTQDLKLLDLESRFRITANRKPIGWAPEDSFSGFVQFLLLGQSSSLRFMPHALAYSPFAYVVRDRHLARIAHVAHGFCESCRTKQPHATEKCPTCSSTPKLKTGEWLLAEAFLEGCTKIWSSGKEYCLPLDNRVFSESRKARRDK